MPLIPAHQEPFSGNWRHFAQHPRGQEGFWRGSGAESGALTATIVRRTDRHKYSEELEAAWIESSKRYKDI